MQRETGGNNREHRRVSMRHNLVKSRSFSETELSTIGPPGEMVLAFGVILTYHLQLVSRRERQIPVCRTR
jgi:hypothetical protein